MIANIQPGMRVLVTGGTGTLGQALIPALQAVGAIVRVMSRDEAKQDSGRRLFKDVEWILGDVRDLRACQDAVDQQDIVIHGASLKYVDISERQPSEYILTNVNGTMNMITAVLGMPTVQQMIGISTDKACAPYNTYGLTKALLEKMFVEAHAFRRGPRSILFKVCRYGNVIGSRGSVILKWQEAVANKQPLKVTDPTMTRFFFTINDALTLIDVTLEFGEGGIIVAQAMPACTLARLAAAMCPNKVEIIGRRPGEKSHEDLLSIHEMPRVTRIKHWRPDSIDDYFIYRPLDQTAPFTRVPEPPYTSATARDLTYARLFQLTKPWRP